MLTRDLLHNYQKRCVNFIKEKKRCALWLDMGLGKSVSSATAFLDLLESLEIGRVLIIAPKRVAVTTWPTELNSWEHLKGLTYSVINGSENERVRAIMKRVDIHVISRDNVSWLVDIVGKRWPWDCVIIDESSSFKSQSSNRWKAIKKVALTRVDVLVELSATPAPQGLIDLWSQMYLIDGGERLGKTEKDFKQRWFSQSGYGVSPKKHAKEEIYDLLSDIVIHLKAEDYLDMPELVYNEVPVDLPPKVMSSYKKFEKDLLLQLDELDLDVEAANAAVLVGKLLQFSNGAVYKDEARNYAVLHDEKIEALKEIVESHRGRPILVAYNFKSDLQRLKKAFPNAVVMDDKQETQDRWNRGEIEMLLTHPKSSGHGLNLQKGSNIIVWFGLNWSLELYLQLVGRLYRQGQVNKTVIVHHIVSRGTVDERVLSVIKGKDATQKALLEAVRMAA